MFFIPVRLPVSFLFTSTDLSVFYKSNWREIGGIKLQQSAFHAEYNQILVFGQKHMGNWCKLLSSQALSHTIQDLNSNEFDFS